ncbi:MAG: hypothetical protein SVO26_00775, partial [Chloroflexota bacterium]|nr:hypothetical protein [Chloroflexota bacterium]
MPRLRQNVYLKFDGTDANEQIMDALVSAEIDDSLTLPDMFAIHLRDPNMEWMDADTFSVGARVELSSRSGESEVKLLTGEITAIEPRLNRDLGGGTVVLRGYDKSHRLNRGKKSKTYQNVKDSDMATSIAGKYGLGSKVDSTQQVYDHVYQDNQTDWEFLIERAQRIGFCVFVKESKLHFVQTPSGETPPALEWNEDLIEFNARLTASRQVSKVVVQ